MLTLTIIALLTHAKTDIALMHRPPRSAPAGKVFVVQGQMMGSSDVEHAEIRYRRKADGPFEKVELELKEGDDYEGLIPAEAMAEGFVEYYVLAFDFLGKSREVFATAKRPQRISVEASTPDPAVTPPPVVSAVTGPVAPTSAVLTPRAAASVVVYEVPPEKYVFTASDILGLGVLTLADLLERVHELSVSRGIDGRYHVARAGMRDDAGVLITLDGQPLSSLVSGSQDLRIPLQLMEEVEISLASASATSLQGTLATINLKSRRTQASLRVVGGGYLSHTTSEPSKTIGTYDGGVAGGGGNDKLQVFARAYGHFSGGAQLNVLQDALSNTGPSLTPGTTADRALRVQGGLTLEVKLAKEHKLVIDADYFRLDHGAYLGSYDIYGPAGTRETNQARLLVAAMGSFGVVEYRGAVGYRLFLGALSSQIVPPDFTTTDRNGDMQPEVFPKGVTDRLRFVEHAIDLDAGVSAKLGDIQRVGARFVLAQHLASGTAFERSATLAGVPAILGVNDIPQPTGDSLLRTQVMLGINDVITPAKWIKLDVGVRFTMMTDIGIILPDVASLVTPAGSVTFKPHDNVDLRLSYDTTVRAPTLQERASPPPYDGHGYFSNLTLRYSAARTAAFDAVYSGRTETFRYRAELRAHYTGATGSIVPIDQTGAGDMYTDQQTIHSGGLAAYARIGFLTRSYIRGGVAWNRSLASVAGINSATVLTDTPQVSATLITNIELGPWADLMLGATLYSERRQNARVPAEQLRPYKIPPQTVVHAQVRTRPLKGVRFVVIAQNALDAARQDDLPRPDLFPQLVPREGLRLLGGLEFSLDELRGRP